MLHEIPGPQGQELQIIHKAKSSHTAKHTVNTPSATCIHPHHCGATHNLKCTHNHKTTHTASKGQCHLPHSHLIWEKASPSPTRTVAVTGPHTIAQPQIQTETPIHPVPESRPGSHSSPGDRHSSDAETALPIPHPPTPEFWLPVTPRSKAAIRAQSAHIQGVLAVAMAAAPGWGMSDGWEAQGIPGALNSLPLPPLPYFPRWRGSTRRCAAISTVLRPRHYGIQQIGV